MKAGLDVVLVEEAPAELASHLAALVQPLFRAFRQPVRHGHVRERRAQDVHRRVALAARAREALGEAAQAGVIDQDRRRDGTLGFGHGLLEAMDRRRGAPQLELPEIGNRQHRARQIADLVEPLAEAMEADQELEGACVGGGRRRV
jgi:hypothetical protein